MSSERSGICYGEHLAGSASRSEEGRGAGGRSSPILSAITGTSMRASPSEPS